MLHDSSTYSMSRRFAPVIAFLVAFSVCSRFALFLAYNTLDIAIPGYRHISGQLNTACVLGVAMLVTLWAGILVNAGMHRRGATFLVAGCARFWRFLRYFDKLARDRRATSIVLAVVFCSSMTFAAKQRVWQQGRLLSFGYEDWESSSTSPVHCSTTGSQTNCTGGQTFSWNHVTYKIALHVGKQTLYAERTLSFRWQHSPKLTENSVVSFAIEKGTLFLTDEAGREFRMHVGKARNNSLADRVQECRQTGEEVRENYPDLPQLRAWLSGLSGLELWRTYMYDLDCTMTAMQAVDIPTNNRYQAILAELLIVRAGDDRETQAAAQEPGTCSAIASSVEADDPKGMSREQIAHNAHVLYRCAMDAFTREPDTWFIATSTARRRLLDELVSRERVLGATAPSK